MLDMMTQTRHRYIMPFFAILMWMALMTGCDSVMVAGGGTETGNPKVLAAFSDFAEMETYLKDQYAATVFPEAIYMAENDTGAAAPDDPQSPSDRDLETVWYSGPDRQGRSPGISPDRVQLDGDWMYMAGNHQVSIIRTDSAATLVQVETIPIPGTVHAVLLDEHTLIVVYGLESGTAEIANEPETSPRIGVPTWIPSQAQTGIVRVDVREPENYQVVDGMQFQGAFIDAVISHGTLCVVSQFVPDIYGLQQTYTQADPGGQETMTQNYQLLAAYSLDDLIPHYRIHQGPQGWGPWQSMVTPENAFHPDTASGGSLVTLITMDLDSIKSDPEITTIVADIHGIDVSEDSVALVSSSWQPDKDSEYGSEIIRFAIESGQVRASGVGRVPGWITSASDVAQFGNRLHIATSTPNAQGSGERLSLYSLMENQGKLQITGTLPLPENLWMDAIRFSENLAWILAHSSDGPYVLMAVEGLTGNQPEIANRLELERKPLGILHLGDGRIWMETKSNDTGLVMTLWDIRDSDMPLFQEDIVFPGMELTPIADTSGVFWDHDTGILVVPVMAAPAEPVMETVPLTTRSSILSQYGYRLDVSTGFQFMGRMDLDVTESVAWMGWILRENALWTIWPQGIRTDALDNMGTAISTLKLMP